MNRSAFVRFSLFVTGFALVVTLLGAYVRLSDAGLGCPDWPGCYGQLTVPEAAPEVAAANATFPQRPLEQGKAWKEMMHRYFAGTLGLLIAVLAFLAWRRRRHRDQILWAPLALVALVVFQALLGMWTVTLLVKPAVVTAHLLGGVATVALLWWLSLRQGRLLAADGCANRRQLKPWAWGGVALVLAQISLGGWTSSNYAALGCTEFPACYGGLWWPPTDFREAFVPWRGLGVNYEYGVLDNPARTAIHLMHRIGALLTLLYVGILAGLLLRRADCPGLRRIGAALAILLGAQIALGVTNVLAQLPMPVAVAHNGGATLLLLGLLALAHALAPQGSATNPGRSPNE